MDTGLSKSQLYVLYASAGLLPAVAHAFHEVLMDPKYDIHFAVEVLFVC